MTDPETDPENPEAQPDAAGVTAEDFDPLVGQEVTLSDGTQEMVLRLTEVLRRGEAQAGLPRAPFSLTLEGPREPVIGQGTYYVDFPGMARMTLLLCPSH